MKNQELFELMIGLQLCKDLKGIKFVYAVAKNLNNINRELAPFVESRAKLQEEHAKKDKDNKLIVVEGRVQMKDDEKFNDEFKKIQDIEVEIDLFKIKREELPEDITAEQLTNIFTLIDE